MVAKLFGFACGISFGFRLYASQRKNFSLLRSLSISIYCMFYIVRTHEFG